MKAKKKKGRPAKNSSLVYDHQTPVNFQSSPLTRRRSAASDNPKTKNSSISPLNHKLDDDDDDDDERREKKVKLVVPLPELEEDKEELNQTRRLHSGNHDSGPASEEEGSWGQETRGKRRKINVVEGGSGETISKVKDALIVTDATKDGSKSPLESGPTTPLPDKKLLLFILDRLQKKDTHNVFSEPVDIEELPDYFDVIEQPMDFGTIRKKLDTGAYDNLEQLEADVFLICSNAMEYNSPNTVFYRQARSIQELAKRDFENLRLHGDDGEPQPIVVRRGRPPSKNPKKLAETSAAADRLQRSVSSDATLANVEEERAVSSSGYNLRKAALLNRFRSNDQFVSSYTLRNGDYSDWLADWNNEFPASIVRADMRHGKKQFTVDETRRDTYGDHRPQFSAMKSPLSAGDMRILVPVGLQEPLAYARSLAMFAANLGFVPWKMASKRIESILPPGVQYGPGWVDEIRPTADPSSFSSELQKPSNLNGGHCSSDKVPVPPVSGVASTSGCGPSQEHLVALKAIHRQGFIPYKMDNKLQEFGIPHKLDARLFHNVIPLIQWGPRSP